LLKGDNDQNHFAAHVLAQLPSAPFKLPYRSEAESLIFCVFDQSRLICFPRSPLDEKKSTSTKRLFISKEIILDSQVPVQRWPSPIAHRHLSCS
jgi:hypothetical protein